MDCVVLSRPLSSLTFSRSRCSRTIEGAHRFRVMLLASAAFAFAASVSPAIAGCNSGNVANSALLTNSACEGAASGTSSTAVGSVSQATGSNSTALGNRADAGGDKNTVHTDRTTAIGAKAQAGTTDFHQDDATAVGFSATANAN